VYKIAESAAQLVNCILSRTHTVAAPSCASTNKNSNRYSSFNELA